jgi:hypothetical protein
MIISSIAITLVTRTYPMHASSGAVTPTLAIELPRSAAEIKSILGTAEDPDKELGTAARVMRAVQYCDMAFYIPSYVIFFVFAGLFMFTQGGSWRRALGLSAMFLIVLCAIFDYLEDFAILDVIASYTKRPPHDAEAQNISYWASLKWATLFSAATCLSPLPIYRWSSQLLRFTGLFIGVYVAVKGVAGISASVSHSPAQISSSVGGIVGLLLFFCPSYAIARNGLVSGLNEVAKGGTFRWLASWLTWDKEPSPDS